MFPCLIRGLFPFISKKETPPKDIESGHMYVLQRRMDHYPVEHDAEERKDGQPVRLAGV
jgi:hypothetical protein